MILGQTRPQLGPGCVLRHHSATGECHVAAEAQARAILELRLQRLTGLERNKIGDELEELAARIKDDLEILDSRDRLLSILRAELTDMKDRSATPRRTTPEERRRDQADEDVSHDTLVGGGSAMAITTDQPAAVDSISITFDIGFVLEAASETLNRTMRISILRHQPPTA